MSSYGPPGRPNQGQPQDPYDQPSDPWGGQDHWTGEEPPADGDGYRRPRQDQPWQDQPGYPDQGQGGYRLPRYGEPNYDRSGYAGTPSQGTGPGYNGSPSPEIRPSYGDESGYGGGPAYGDGPAYGGGLDHGNDPGYRAGSGYGGGLDHGSDPGYRDGSGYGAGLGYPGAGGGGSAYGDGPAYGGGPGYGAGSAYGGAVPPTGPAPEPAPGWDRPEPPGRGSNRMFVAFVVVLAVLVLAGGGGAFYLVNRDKEPTASPTTPAAGATDAGQPAGGGTGTEQSPTPAPESSAEARFAAKGQCLVNDGTDKDPKMRIVKCGGSTYEVLARFDGTTDYKGKCGKVQGYQFHYFFDSELDVLDFVLCLKKR